jgi:hypothetical protein
MSRRAGVWLATLSTVVGVATGMFTLRDQVFPQESGTAGAISENAYRADVGEICDELNDADRARRRDDRRLGKELEKARTTLAQRDALLDAARRSSARSSHALAGFAALRPPATDRATHRSTAGVWTQNVERLDAYVARLDQADGRKGLMVAVRRLAHDRPAFARDGRQVNTGLKRLGENRCVIDPPVVPKTVTLPADPQRPSPRVNTPKGTPTATPAPGAPDPAPQVGPSVNPPATNAPAPTRPRVNTPSTDGPIGGGGGEDG